MNFLMNAFKKLFHFPATLLSGFASFLLGSDGKDKDGKAVSNSGVIGWGLKAIANFISNHKTAIAAAIWGGLLVAGAAALTVALWPAALAAVATFSVGGVTIAALVGTGFAAQVGAVAAIAGLLAAAGILPSAVIVGALNSFKNWAFDKFSGGTPPPAAGGAQQGLESGDEAPAAFSQLGGPAAPVVINSYEPSASYPVFSQQAPQSAAAAAAVNTEEATQALASNPR